MSKQDTSEATIEQQDRDAAAEALNAMTAADSGDEYEGIVAAEFAKHRLRGESQAPYRRPDYATACVHPDEAQKWFDMHRAHATRWCGECGALNRGDGWTSPKRGDGT